MTEISWVDDPSIFYFWLDDPAWVGDPEDVDAAFLVAGSGRASATPFPDLPPLREAPDALGGITTVL